MIKVPANVGTRRAYPVRVFDEHSAFKLTPSDNPRGGFLVRCKDSEATVFPSIRRARRAYQRSLLVSGSYSVKPSIRPVNRG